MRGMRGAQGTRGQVIYRGSLGVSRGVTCGKDGVISSGLERNYLGGPPHAPLRLLSGLLPEGAIGGATDDISEIGTLSSEMVQEGQGQQGGCPLTKGPGTDA